MNPIGNRLPAGKKRVTSSFFRLDIRQLQHSGALEPGFTGTAPWARKKDETISLHLRSESHRVWLSSIRERGSDSWQSDEHPISVEWTACNYGGARAWFRCPMPRCGRRVAILYVRSMVACRRCHHLAYPSQRLAPHARALRRARRIRIRLGGSQNMLEPFPAKPRGMHWRTYRRLHSAARESERQSCPPWLLKKLFRVARYHSAAQFR